MTNRYTLARSQHGLSLIELMIALVVGLVLIGGMVTVFSGTKRSSDVNITLTELQESARFALDSMVRDVRMAGFQGCIDSAGATVRATNAPTTDFFATALTGSLIESDGTWTPAAPIGFTPPAQGSAGAPVPGTHALSVQFGSPETWPIDRMPNTFSPVVLADGVRASDIGIVSGDVALVSDCQVADIFTVSGTTGSSVAHANDVNRLVGPDGRLSAAYGETGGADNTRARLMRFEANLYYVGNTGRTNGEGNPVHALYRLALPYVSPPPLSTANAPIEMVEGVTRLQLRLGVSRPGPGGELDFVAPDDVPAQIAATGGAVRRVEIGLLMQSFDPVAESDDARIYPLAGANLSPGTADAATTYRSDRRMRLAFNTTVDIRNR